MSTITKAQAAYQAYAKSTGGKTWDGRDMPTFEQLPTNIATAWHEAAEAAYRQGRDDEQEAIEYQRTHKNNGSMSMRTSKGES